MSYRIGYVIGAILGAILGTALFSVVVVSLLALGKMSWRYLTQ